MNNFCRLVGFPAGLVSHGPGGITHGIEYVDYGPSGRQTLVKSYYGVMKDCDVELMSINGCGDLSDAWVADVGEGERIECSRVRFHLDGGSSGGISAEPAAVEHPLATTASGVLLADRFLEHLPTGCAATNGETFGWGGTAATSGPVCDQNMDDATADRVCSWMGFDRASSYTKGRDLSSHGGGASFPIGALSCAADAHVPEDCTVQTMEDATGEARSGDSTGACVLPDDGTAAAPLPSECGGSSGVQLTCERDWIVRVMPESHGGQPVEDYTRFTSQDAFDGVVMVQVHGQPQHRVCAAAADLDGDAGQRIGDAVCRSMGYPLGAWKGSVRAGKGPAVYDPSVPVGVQLRSCSSGASAVSSCQHDLLEPSLSWWEAGDTCASRGLVDVRVSCQERELALMRYYKYTDDQALILTPQAPAGGSAIPPYQGLLVWKASRAGAKIPQVCSPSYSGTPEPDAAIALVCQELGYSGAPGTFMIRPPYDFRYQYTQGMGQTLGMGATNMPLGCLGLEEELTSIGDCTLLSSYSACGNREAYSVQCATPTVELREGQQGVLEARLTIPAEAAAGSGPLVGGWGPVCFGAGQRLEATTYDGYCQAMGTSTAAVKYEQPKQIDDVPTSIQGFTAKNLECSGGNCTADGYFEHGWERANSVGCVVVQIQCKEGD